MSLMRTWMVLLPALFLAACGSDSPTAVDVDPEPEPEPSFVLLPTLGGDGSWAYSVSNDGMAVGMANNGASDFLAVRWTADGSVEPLLPAEASFGTSSGVSVDGRVVAGYFREGSNPAHVFRWTESGGFEDLGTVDGAAALTWRLSGDGSTIVGGANYPGTPMDAAIWTADGTAQLLGTLGEGNRAFASAVSFDGSVVVGSSRGQPGVSGDRAFRWTAAGGMVELPGIPEGGENRADAVSPDGSRIAGHADVGGGATRATLWVGSAEPVLLGSLGPEYLHHRAWAMTSDGAMIVGRAAFDGNHTGDRAVVWNAAGQITDLNETWADLIPAGWRLGIAWDISQDGRFIVGEARSGDLTRGFLLDTAGR